MPIKFNLISVLFLFNVLTLWCVGGRALSGVTLVVGVKDRALVLSIVGRAGVEGLGARAAATVVVTYK